VNYSNFACTIKNNLFENIDYRITTYTVPPVEPKRSFSPRMPCQMGLSWYRYVRWQARITISQSLSPLPFGMAFERLKLSPQISFCWYSGRHKYTARQNYSGQPIQYIPRSMFFTYFPNLLAPGSGFRNQIHKAGSTNSA
jgi:hypothetical protein